MKSLRPSTFRPGVAWAETLFKVMRLSVFLLLTAVSAQLRPGVRIRLNKGIFEQASSIVAGLVEYEVPRIQIPSSQQCFTEGCVQIHSFQMTSFRQPQYVSFEPAPPNRFAIRVSDFDFFVAGRLSGTIQVLIQLPVSGSVYVSGMGISVVAYLDLQKTLDDEPYLRFLECSIDRGHVHTRVADMGLFTDTVNSKYTEVMSQTSRQQLEEAICANMHRLTQQHFSTRLARLPRSISAQQLMDVVLAAQSTTNNGNPNLDAYAIRHKRAPSIDYYDDIDAKKAKPKPRPKPVVTGPIKKVKFSSHDINNFFNMNRLGHIMIDTTLMDAFATTNDFTVGMAGHVRSLKSPGEYPMEVPYPFRLPANEQRRQVEVIISNHTLNSLLWQAHRTNSLLFHVDSRTPGVGSVLKTTCSPDEVCLSDQIEEVGTTFPGRSLELIIRSIRAPIVSVRQNQITLDMAGRALFFLEGTRQKIGAIPFYAVVTAHIKTYGTVIKGTMSIDRLTIDNDVDFFKLSSSDLDGFRESVQIALEKMGNAVLSEGIPIATHRLRFPLRLSAAHLALLNDAILLQANVDLYNSLYGDSRQ